MAYADAGATTEAYDLVGFLDDSEDTEETLTDITVSFDDFRVYEGALTGDELITEVKCTEA